MNSQTASPGIFFLSCITVVFSLSSLNAHADALKTATIATVKNQVLITKEGEKGQAAVVKGVLQSNAEISTGKDSHVELHFADRSMVRLGSNTIFSFDPKTRDMKIQRGIALIHVPPRQGSTQIITPLGTASIHRDVIAVRCEGKNGVTEFVHLSPEDQDGIVTVKHHKTGEEREVGAGQLLRIYPSEDRFRKPLDISVAVFNASAWVFKLNRKNVTVMHERKNIPGDAVGLFIITLPAKSENNAILKA